MTSLYVISKNSFILEAGITISFVLIILTILVGTTITHRENDLNAIIEKANQGYTVYVNGTIVDINNIDLEYYRYSIDDEEQKIILTVPTQ